MITKHLTSTIFLICFCPVLATSLQEGRPDFTREQVVEANNQFDAIVRRAGSEERIAFEFTDAERKTIITKYLRDSDRSPHFWPQFKVRLVETYRAIVCVNCANAYPRAWRATSAVRDVVSKTRTEEWGDLVLESDPPGAEVYLGSNKEGSTKIARRYPEGDYTFILQKNGYQRTELPVTIKKDAPVDKIVKLQPQ